MKNILHKKTETVKSNLAKNSNFFISKKDMRQYYIKSDKVYLSEEEEKYGIALAKSILNKHRITFFKIQKYDIRYIILTQIFKMDIINAVAEDMKSNGFILDTVNTSYILIKSYK